MSSLNFSLGPGRTEVCLSPNGDAPFTYALVHEKPLRHYWTHPWFDLGENLSTQGSDVQTTAYCRTRCAKAAASVQRLINFMDCTGAVHDAYTPIPGKIFEDPEGHSFMSWYKGRPWDYPLAWRMEAGAFFTNEALCLESALQTVEEAQDAGFDAFLLEHFSILGFPDTHLVVVSPPRFGAPIAAIKVLTSRLKPAANQSFLT